MEAYISQWLNLLVRWMHFIFGAAWIGTSFYFNWLNNHIRPSEDLPEGVAGDLWSVHGGAFYHVEKFAVAPKKIPETLHWFMWEAYLTWITGIALLAIVYYWGADAYLIDKSVADIPAGVGIGIGVATLAGGWVVYDLLCKSPLVKKPVVLALVGFALLTGVAYGLSNVFSPRAAYLHVGALIGTCMAANVFFVIIPGQRKMVAAAMKSTSPDPAPGRAGALRSLHNNYLTLPVLFIMISHHFPMTFGNGMNWAVLAAISLLGAGVRHWFNLAGKGHHNVWILPAAAVGMLALAFAIRPVSSAPTVTVDSSEVRQIIADRCVSCHSANPTNAAFPVAPSGFVLDTDDQIRSRAALIHDRTVIAKTMPLGNMTQMTDDERVMIDAWYQAGAPLD